MFFSLSSWVEISLGMPSISKRMAFRELCTSASFSLETRMFTPNEAGDTRVVLELKKGGG